MTNGNKSFPYADGRSRHGAPVGTLVSIISLFLIRKAMLVPAFPDLVLSLQLLLIKLFGFSFPFRIVEKILKLAPWFPGHRGVLFAS